VLSLSLAHPDFAELDVFQGFIIFCITFLHCKFNPKYIPSPTYKLSLKSEDNEGKYTDEEALDPGCKSGINCKHVPQIRLVDWNVDP